MSKRSTSVDDFLAQIGHPRADDIQRLRREILDAEPELHERIKWNAPSFGFADQDRVTFRLQPGDRCELIVHRGASVRHDPFEFDDPDDLIAWATNDRGTISVPVGPSDQELSRIVAVVQRWLAATRDE